MATIDILLRNIRAVNVRSVVEDSLEDIKPALIRLQRLQMLTGYRSDGKRIGKYKNKEYSLMKFQQNPLAGFGFADLRLEGFFQGDVFVEVRENEIVFDSINEKTPDLVNRYGEDIFGLNKKNIKEAVDNYLQPKGVENFTKRILK